MIRNKFVGFSTVDRDKPPYKAYDVDLIKRDLLNHFHTRRGERVMRPNYGSNIHEYLFDPLDEITKQDIIDDVERVVNSDPRVEYISSDLTELSHGLKVDVVLRYLTDQSIDTLYINFNRDLGEEL